MHQSTIAMIPRRCRPSGCLKAHISPCQWTKSSLRPFHATQCVKTDDKSGGSSSPAGARTRKAASAAASRDIQNLRPTVDLRNRGVKSPPTGAPVVRPSLSPIVPRGGRDGGKFIRIQRDGGDRPEPGSTANRSAANTQPARGPRDAAFQYGPRRINPKDGPGGSSFRGRPRNTGVARARSVPGSVRERGPSGRLGDEAGVDAEQEEEYNRIAAEMENDDEERTLEGWLADESAEKQRYPTEEESELMMNEDHWVRLECATMEPVPEALPTFSPAEVTAASLLAGRASLPIGAQGMDQMVDLQIRRATKRGELVTTTHDMASNRFKKGQLVSFGSQEEMEWALYRRNWEAKARKIISGEPVAFKDATERGAVANLVREEVIRAVQERHQGVVISSQADLQQDGIQLELNELAVLDRLAMYEKEGQLPKDPEQAELMRSILNIPTMTAEEKSKAAEKYPDFAPVDRKIRDEIMGKMVAGKYDSAGEKGLAASVQQLTLNNGSYLPNKERDLLEKVKSYLSPGSQPKA